MKKENLEAHNTALGKTISSASIENNALILRFSDGTGLKIWDGGQNCCEDRYMNCDDDLTYFAGATFTGAEVRDVSDIPVGWGVHEVQFLTVNTSKGVISVANHNEHNGYYGGFGLMISQLQTNG